MTRPPQQRTSTTFLAFSPGPVVLISLITYLVLWFAFFYSNDLEDVPSPKRQHNKGLDIEEAWKDLSKITAHPHPFNSHANDDANVYIRNRLAPLARMYPHVHLVVDDRSGPSSSGTNQWVIQRSSPATGYGVYFEGTNIMVKIDAPPPDPSEDEDDRDDLQRIRKDGVLFSAHYDSVSTAPGATDDGMGVATVMQLVRLFAELPRVGQGRMKRDAVFLINNGEEDWLNGAHAFLEHPWSNLTNTFLNLEGAAAGGRPILFRATSVVPLRAVQNEKLVKHPHATVVTSDAFARGAIRSGTDYSVFSGPRYGLTNGSFPWLGLSPDGGMQGLDLAFYKGRNRYHTKFDAVPYTEGGRKSLWAMMDVARGIGLELVCGEVAEKERKQEREHLHGGSDEDTPVYFDWYKQSLVVFPIHYLLNFNIVFLIIGPISLALFAIAERIFLRKSRGDDDSDSDSDSDDEERRYPQRRSESQGYGSRRRDRRRRRRQQAAAQDEQGKPSRATRFWMHMRFWVALLVAAVVLTLHTWSFVLFNPFAIYSHPYTVLLSYLTLTYLIITYSLALPSSLPFFKESNVYPFSTVHQKHAIFHHLYFLTWVLLIFGTVGITTFHPGLGSGYLITAWNTCVGLGCILVSLETIVTGIRCRNDMEAYQRVDNHPPQQEEPAPYLPNPYPSERTPLVGPSSNGNTANGNNDRAAAALAKMEWEAEREAHESWWWFPQFLVSVPIPVVLFGSVVVLLLDGMSQTLADGAKASGLYTLIALSSVIVVLPLAPFSPALAPSKTHARQVWGIIFGLCLFSTFYGWFCSPFSHGGQELKVYFQQQVELAPTFVNSLYQTSHHVPANMTDGIPADHDIDILPSRIHNITTTLTGPRRYLRSRVIPKLPSAMAAERRAERLGDEKEGIQCQDNKPGQKAILPGYPNTPGLTTCIWRSTVSSISTDPEGSSMKPFPGNLDKPRVEWGENEYFRASVRKMLGGRRMKIKIRGRNTRGCRVYFDNRGVLGYTVHVEGDGGNTPPPSLPPGASVDGELQFGYGMPEDGRGIREIRLWSNEWEREWTVDVRLEESDYEDDVDRVKGRVACEWNEFQSGRIDVGRIGDGDGGRIPAYEELLAFLPDWVVPTKVADGLVEVSRAFVV